MLKQVPWKPFVISFIAVFLMVLLPKLGFFSHSETPLVSPQQNSIKTIFQRLKLITNNYYLHTPNNLINTAKAAAPYQDATAYVVVDYETGTVIESKNLNKPLPVASLTKIMSTVIALDLAKPDDLFTVGDHAAKIIPTKIGVVPGQKLTVKELITAAILTSANDAVEVLKENIDNQYGNSTFVEAMNQKAQFLELNQTSFTNPQGFDNPNNHSSVHDLAILTHYALTNYPLLGEVAQKPYQFLPEDSNHKQFDLYNWNGLIGSYPDTIGMKIGNTEQAGYTTVVVSNRNNRKVLAIVLGAPRVLERDLWASQLLDQGYSQIANLSPVNLTEKQLKEKYSTWKFWN